MSQGEILIDKKTILELLNSLPQEIIYQDLDHRILWVNKNIIEKYGPMEEIAGKYCYMLKYKRKQPCEFCLVKKARETGERQTLRLLQRMGKAF